MYAELEHRGQTGGNDDKKKKKTAGVFVCSFAHFGAHVCVFAFDVFVAQAFCASIVRSIPAFSVSLHADYATRARDSKHAPLSLASYAPVQHR